MFWHVLTHCKRQKVWLEHWHSVGKQHTSICKCHCWRCQSFGWCPKQNLSWIQDLSHRTRPTTWDSRQPVYQLTSLISLGAIHWESASLKAPNGFFRNMFLSQLRPLWPWQVENPDSSLIKTKEQLVDWYKDMSSRCSCRWTNNWIKDGPGSDIVLFIYST